MSGIGKGAGDSSARTKGDGGAVCAARTIGAGDGCIIAGRSRFCDGIGAGGQIAKGLGAASVGDGKGAQVAGELPVMAGAVPETTFMTVNEAG